MVFQADCLSLLYLEARQCLGSCRSWCHFRMICLLSVFLLPPLPLYMYDKCCDYIEMLGLLKHKNFNSPCVHMATSNDKVSSNIIETSFPLLFYFCSSLFLLFLDLLFWQNFCSLVSAFPWSSLACSIYSLCFLLISYHVHRFVYYILGTVYTYIKDASSFTCVGEFLYLIIEYS